MNGLWVFILDPKNFLALIGLWTVIRWAVKLTRWVSRPRKTVRPTPVNLNGKIDP